MSGIYIHVPFCAQKCTYCDFASYPKEISKAESYFACLYRELEGRAKQCKEKTFDTVYIGGGTPFALEVAELERVLSALAPILRENPSVEYTVEAGRPDTFTEEKLALLKK